jgi:prevent-host-death family protein
MKTVNTHEAKTHLSRLLKRVALGEQITIASRGTAVARLVPIAKEDSRRGLGMFRGKFVVPADFDASLPDDFLFAPQGKTKRTRKKK